MFALLAGLNWRLYVALALVAVVAGLGLAVAYYKNSAERAEAQAALASDQRDRAIEALADSEKANQKLKALNDSLDAALVERDRRAKALVTAQAALKREINELKQSLDEADKACLNRDLPNSILELLRDRPGNPDPR